MNSSEAQSSDKPGRYLSKALSPDEFGRILAEVAGQEDLSLEEAAYLAQRRVVQQAVAWKKRVIKRAGVITAIFLLVCLVVLLVAWIGQPCFPAVRCQPTVVPELTHPISQPASLELSIIESGTPPRSGAVLPLEVILLDSNGQPFTQTMQVRFSVEPAEMGTVRPPITSTISGRAKAFFQADQLAGPVTIVATVTTQSGDLFDSQSIELLSAAAPALAVRVEAQVNPTEGVYEGQVVELLFVVDNQGNAPVTDVTVHIRIPQGAALTSTLEDCSLADEAETVACPLGSVAYGNGEDATRRLFLTTLEPGHLTLTADNYWLTYQDGDEPVVGSNEVSVVVSQRPPHIFNGQVYFQGVNAPASATIRLIRCDFSLSQCGPADGDQATQIVQRPDSYLTEVTAVPFKLVDEFEEANITYQIVIESPPDTPNDWLAVAPSPAVITSSIVQVSMPVIGPVPIDNITFAGPLPILFDFHNAHYTPAYNPAAATPDWGYEGRLAEYPYMIWLDEGPNNQSVQWPIWLPADTPLQLLVGLPPDPAVGALNNLFASNIVYKLLLSSDNNELWRSNPVRLCSFEDDAGSQKTAEPLIQLESTGLFWLWIDNQDGDLIECHPPDGVNTRYRMPIWQLTISRPAMPVNNPETGEEGE